MFVLTFYFKDNGKLVFHMNFFKQQKCPQKLFFMRELAKGKFCAIYNVGMVAKNSHPHENGHLQTGGFWSFEHNNTLILRNS